MNRAHPACCRRSSGHRSGTDTEMATDPDNIPPRSRLFIVVPKNADAGLIQVLAWCNSPLHQHMHASCARVPTRQGFAAVLCPSTVTSPANRCRRKWPTGQSCNTARQTSLRPRESSSASSRSLLPRCEPWSPLLTVARCAQTSMAISSLQL